jgi:hypothetical protein
MGEEKTAINFVLVSLLLLAFLLLYPTLVIVSARTAYNDQQYSFTAITEILRFEKEMAKLNSFIVLPRPRRIPTTQDPPSHSPTPLLPKSSRRSTRTSLPSSPTSWSTSTT